MTGTDITGDPPAPSSVEDRLARAGLPPLPRTAWLEIDTDALRGNLRAVRSLAGPGVGVAPVVKADAYGHGLEGVLDAIAGEVRMVCVATLDEGFAVRAVSGTLRVLVLYPIPDTNLPAVADARLELVASEEADTRRLLGSWAALPHAPGVLRLHLEVETGLQRGGIVPERIAPLAVEIHGAPLVKLAGLWSHLARAEDAGATARQVERFDAAATELRRAGVPLPMRHLAASGGLFAGTAPSYDLVRPGLCLYGGLPDDIAALAGPERCALLRPAMTLKARPVRVAQIGTGTPVGYGGRWVSERPSVIATLPVGYGDGWVRAYAPSSRALVRGRSVPLVGSVAMDAVAADVTDIPGVSDLDEFVLLGAQGDQRITASELARTRTTISWEVFSSMAQRLPRVYHAGPEIVALRTSGVQSVHRVRGRAS